MTGNSAILNACTSYAMMSAAALGAMTLNDHMAFVGNGAITNCAVVEANGITDSSAQYSATVNTAVSGSVRLVANAVTVSAVAVPLGWSRVS